MTIQFPDEDYVPFSPGELLLADLWKPTTAQTIVRGDVWAVYMVKADGTQQVYYDSYHNDPIQQQAILDALKLDLDPILSLLQQDDCLHICLGYQNGWSTEVRSGQPLQFKRSTTYRQPCTPSATSFTLQGIGEFLDTAVEPPHWNSQSSVQIEIQGSTIQKVYGRTGSDQQDLFFAMSTNKMIRVCIFPWETKVYLYDGMNEFSQPIAGLPISAFDRDSLFMFVDEHTRGLEIL